MKASLVISHVLPALITKFITAKEFGEPYVTIWVTGSVMREFLYIDDMAEGCLYLMENYARNDIVNLGTGKEISIGDLAECIKQIVGYEGELKFDSSQPKGTPRKVPDMHRIHGIGWRAQTFLLDGITQTIS